MSKLAALVATPIALAVLAAHFARSGRFALAVVALALVALLFVRRKWAARTLQIALALGAIEWLRTLLVLVAERQAAGLSYTRLALILGAVAVATALCGCVPGPRDSRPLRWRRERRSDQRLTRRVHHNAGSCARNRSIISRPNADGRRQGARSITSGRPSLRATIRLP
jgi:hypothetical protein